MMTYLSTKSIIIILILSAFLIAQPKLPIGMNIGSNNYYSQCLVYNDVMKTASAWISFNAEGDSPWNTELIDQISFDSCGYPTSIPYTPAGEVAQKVRFLINNNYLGTYILLFDGEGDISINNAVHEKLANNKYSIKLTGNTEHVWIDINLSQAGNYIHNFRIIPNVFDGHENEMPLFYAPFLKGLQPFHTLRFMDWMRINGSEQKEWDDRAKTYCYSSGLTEGMPIEDAVELCNTLQTDAWFCVPHQADDDYITRFAELVRDHLNINLKVYVEYSNEIWNWGFDQSHYVGQNAQGHNNQYVIDDLTAIHPTEYIHPEKDAYMMQRTFRLWSDVFNDDDSDRLIRVATGQHAWMDNTRRILEYLFNRDMDGSRHTEPVYSASTAAGCDAFAVGGYFNFSESQHLIWNAMNPMDVTPDMIIDSVFAIYDETSGSWTDETAKFVNAFNVDYLVYEGGQHMQPYLQGEYDYNQAVWDTQIHPRMYDLYMFNFAKHVDPEVDCKLFMAFSYVSERESRWGSWGHLESLQQVGATDYQEIAPKYQALLDANTTKVNQIGSGRYQVKDFHLYQNYPNPFNPKTNICYSVGTIYESSLQKIDLSIYNILGQKVVTLVSDVQSSGQYKVQWDATRFPSGIYFYQLKAKEYSATGKMILVR